MRVFGWWEEAGENPRTHGENMQTLHRKAPGEATVLPPQHHANLFFIYFIYKCFYSLPVHNIFHLFSYSFN